jgi:hypothetical protein
MALFKNTITSLEKKTIFASTLFNVIKESKHRIVIHYEWKRPDQILTIFASKNNTITLGINLNIIRHKYFERSIEKTELQLRYRAFFIEAYIRCLDDAAVSFPQTYFSGLVLLCAINVLCSGKTVNAFSPIERKPRDLNTIDIYCAIHAFKKMIVNYADKLTKDTIVNFNNLIGELLLYSTLPEIGYKGNKTIYSLLQEIRVLYGNLMSHRCEESNYALFDNSGITRDKIININDLASICEECKDFFWGNVVVRLSAHLNERINLQKTRESFITDCVKDFERKSVRYFFAVTNVENSLLLDNFMAIKKMSRKKEYAFSYVTSDSGNIHFFGN